jgi:hypothetical protein
VGDDFEGGLGAEDGVAALALAAFDGFEEEAWGFALVVGDEAAVGEDGGELVGEKAQGEGDGQGVGGVGVGCREGEEGIAGEVGH